jgi:hypothetical protein
MRKKIIVSLTHYECDRSENLSYTELSVSMINRRGKEISEPGESVFSEYMVIENPEKYLTIEKQKHQLLVNDAIFDLIRHTLNSAQSFSHSVKYDWEIMICSQCYPLVHESPFCDPIVKRAYYDDTSTQMLGTNFDSNDFFA